MLYTLTSLQWNIVPVLFIYDTFVTFGREVVCFWTTKWSGAPLLFFANKWISIIICVMQLVQLAPFPSDEVSFFVVYEAEWELTRPEVRSVSPKDPLRDSRIHSWNSQLFRVPDRDNCTRHSAIRPLGR